ncbi:MAG: hypothetical protein WC661_05125 [Opitutaceae bacterium]
MALNIALGQLQLTLGPDARVTAAAAQKGDGTAGYAAADFDNNSNWIGVYRQNPDTAFTTRDPQLLTWLVSGNQSLSVPATGANTPTAVPNAAVTGLATTMSATSPVMIGGAPAVLLVGPGSTMAETAAAAPASTVDRFVVAPLADITVKAGVLPGFSSASPDQVVGHFAYWVGDEGMKAKVTVVDPWESPTSATLNATNPAPTTPDQAQDYRFINSPRMGIEGVKDNAGSALGAAYPATDADFKTGLSKVMDLAQLPLANSIVADQTKLSSTQRSRFHDLTASSYSLPVDVVNGGFKKDLTAWLGITDVSDPAFTTPNPSAPATANDDYIATGDPADSSKYSLPKWGLIRDYAQTFATTAALAPRRQTATQQGIFPVITYARMGYNLTCAAANTPPDLNIMPVVALWNPYNVKIAAKTYEFCVQYSNLSPTSPGERLYIRTGSYKEDPILAPEDFDFSLIRVSHSANFNSSENATITAGIQEYGENTQSRAEYFRFKLEVSKDMEPGESRLFTICDAVDSPDGHDGTLYKSGVSMMSDRGGLRGDVGVNNAVRMRGQVRFNSKIVDQTQVIFLYPHPYPYAIMNYARVEVLLSDPLPATVSSSDTSAVRQFLRSNAYQRITGAGFEWQNSMEALSIPPQNTGEPLFYHRIELMMSDLPTPFPESNLQAKQDPGSPRWLATLNPQASTFLRKPFIEQTGVARSNFNPSYLVEYYVKPPNAGVYLNLVQHGIPNADSTGRVSAGTRVSNTSGGAQNMVIRELPSATVPLFSLAQLQHVNASLINLNPAYAIGNSHANIYVNRNAAYTVLTNTDSFASDDAVASANPGNFPGGPLTGFPDAATFNRIYDLSYLLNKALWDGYFFSTIPASLTLAQAANSNFHLPNNRHEFNWSTGSANAADVADLKTTNKAAAHLRVNGGFNVNSTSVEAWRALLYGHNGVVIDPADSLNKNTFSRFATVLSAPFAGSKANDTWMGYRILSDAQIDALAPKIVAEIRARGPFLSLADFVNRRLVADNTGLKGVLQAAIDATTTNQASTAVALQVSNYPRDIKDNTNKVVHDLEQQIVYAGAVNATNTAPDITASSASRVSLAPGYLSQADLLTAVGPSLAARSDTFRIRAYGDIQSVANGSIEGRAWCEAIVQRSADYVSAADASTVIPANLTAAANKTFGRRFKIISFRWLSPNEI